MQTAYYEQDRVEKIHAGPGKKYMSEVFTDLILPFGILNKGKTGCGGTTVAIESPFNYIIFMPTIELINNKLSHYKDRADQTYSVNGNEYKISLLGVHGNIYESETEIYQYIKEQEYYSYPIKILATYDSAYKLNQIIGDIFYSHCTILVDEMHSLMTEYNYRSSAIEKLLAVLTNHPRVTYMSATPIAPTDGPVQLESLPRHEVIWSKDRNTQILLTKTRNPTCSVVEMIYTLDTDVSHFSMEVNGEIFYPDQFFFYINSVKQIRQILEKLDKKVSNKVNIVCTDNSKNRQTLDEYAELIGSTYELKKFNLLTKKAFVGCDIYSPLGVPIVITDVNFITNYLDPCIDILQIIGRIRNEENPFRDCILHLTNSDAINKSRSRSSREIGFSGDEPIIKENVSRYLMYQRRVHQKYESIIASYEDSGQHAEFGILSNIINKYCTFDQRKSIKIIYNILSDGGNEMDLRPMQKIVWDRNPEIKKFIDIFGIEKLKAVSFKPEKIKELIKEESPDIKAKITTNLKQKIKVGSEYSRKEIKCIMKETYKEAGLAKSAKATDIQNYYKIKPVTRYGKPNVSCFRIIDVKQN